MDDAFLMGGCEATRDLDAILNCFSNRKRTRRQTLPQRFAFQQFGDDVRRFVGGADIEDRENVRMIECRGRARFLLKTGQSFRVC